MRIVHVSVGSVPVLYRYGGAIQRRIIEIAQEQAARGHEVVVYSVGEADGRLHHGGVEVRFLACRSSSRYRHLLRLGWIELQMRVAADLRRERVDILHFHSQPEGALLSRGIPAVKFLSFDSFLFHGGRGSPLYPFYRRSLNAFDGLLPVSGYCLDESRRYWGLPPDRMHVLYNGVNVGQFHPDADLQRAEKEALGIEERVILYLGRVCRQKGTDLLLDAYRALRRRRDDIRLVVAGPIGQFGRLGGDNGEWQDRIRDVGGLYLGPVAEERVAGLYNLADIFVMPTREFEMFGMAAVEAQACGKPVVASDHGGLRETVPVGCGARFATGDHRDLAEKIGYLLDDREAYHLASSRARDNALSFGWARIAERLGDLYKAAS